MRHLIKLKRAAAMRPPKLRSEDWDAVVAKIPQGILFKLTARQIASLVVAWLGDHEAEIATEGDTE